MVEKPNKVIGVHALRKRRIRADAAKITNFIERTVADIMASDTEPARPILRAARSAFARAINLDVARVSDFFYDLIEAMSQVLKAGRLRFDRDVTQHIDDRYIADTLTHAPEEQRRAEIATLFYTTALEFLSSIDALLWRKSDIAEAEKLGIVNALNTTLTDNLAFLIPWPYLLVQMTGTMMTLCPTKSLLKPNLQLLQISSLEYCARNPDPAYTAQIIVMSAHAMTTLSAEGYNSKYAMRSLEEFYQSFRARADFTAEQRMAIDTLVAHYAPVGSKLAEVALANYQTFIELRMRDKSAAQWVAEFFDERMEEFMHDETGRSQLPANRAFRGLVVRQHAVFLGWNTKAARPITRRRGRGKDPKPNGNGE